MKQSDYVLAMSSLMSAFTNMRLEDTFHAPSSVSNEEAARLHECRKAITELAVASALHSSAKKRYEAAKKKADEVMPYSEIENASSATIFSDQDFSFIKRRAKGTTDVKVADLCIALARFGVSNEVIQTALATAEKPKAGNLYYIVEKIGE